jgi:alkylation response protein AidB-like acyl-CoA dehydrogenase
MRRPGQFCCLSLLGCHGRPRGAFLSLLEMEGVAARSAAVHNGIARTPSTEAAVNRIAQIEAPSAAIPDSRGLNFFRADPDLAALIGIHLPGGLARTLVPQLDRLGALIGERLDDLAATADGLGPVLHPRTRAGEDRDRIEKHPAYGEMERIAFGELGLAAMSHRAGVFGWPEPLPPIAKYLVTYLFAQAEFGLLCPVSMTDSLTRTLRRFGDRRLVDRYLPGLVSQDMDALLQGAMFMTEQGAGSDVGATTVRAEPAPDGSWRLTGEKWFCSNADADLAMVLARPAGAPAGLKGVSLFLLPRHLPDGGRNAYRIVRLKDKLGTRSMASGEISLAGATAWMIGEPGDGFRQMADMINNSRLSNGVRSAGMMRRAATEALFVAHRRRAFGRHLIDMPLMRRQLAKIVLPAEQARTCMFLTAEALRRADAGDEGAYPLLRILTPLIKFRACRDARRVTGDAMEVRGGCGYIEEFPDARLLRDSHLGSIWEGTSNIVALDVLRAGRREGAFAALRAHVDRLSGPSPAIAELPGLAARAFALAEQAAGGPEPALARQAATALYNVTTAAAMLDEACRLVSGPASTRRLALARLVVRHRLSRADPLDPAAGDPALVDAVLYDPAAAA